MFKIINCMVIVGILCCTLLVGTLTFADEYLGEKPEWMPDISAETAFLTKYIWRGFNLGNEPVMQLDFSASKYGFTFDWWSNYSLNGDKTIDGGRYQEFTEMDYTIDYTFNVGELRENLDMEPSGIIDPLSVSTGYTYYTFPNTDWDTDGFDSHEVYISIAYDILLQPFVTWYWDVDSGKGVPGDSGRGSYYLAGIGHTFEFESEISADLGMTVGYNDEQWTANSGWADMVFSCSVSIPVLEYFTITPSVAYSVILDRDTFNDAEGNEFFGGIAVGFSY